MRTAAIVLMSSVVLLGQNQPTFKVNVDLVTTDAIVRDARGQFIADLKAGELEVYEDGVRQAITSLTMIHGGREFNGLSPPVPAAELEARLAALR